MKKISIIILFSVFNLMLCAQGDLFTLNELGVCEITRQLDGDDASDLYKKIKSWLGTCNMTWNAMPYSDIVNTSLNFNAYFNCSRSFNPFAGWFEQNLIFDGYFVIEGTTAVLKLNNFRIKESYNGFGQSINETAIEDKIKELEHANFILTNGADPSLSKKEQKKTIKEAKDIKEDLDKILTKSSEELSERLDKLNNIFK